MRWDSMYRNQNCPHCRWKKISEDRMGDKNPMWNPNLTDEEREKYNKGRGWKSTKWKNDVIKCQHGICSACGCKVDDIEAHHLNGYNWDIENRYNVENGVCLCSYHHYMFHSMYGYGNNTSDQFDDFIEYLYYVSHSFYQ